MKKDTKRKHERIDSLNLLNYKVIDAEGELISQGMGRTLNVSQGGILLETHVSFPLDYHISLNIGLEDDMIDIKGKVIYCRDGEERRYESGIEFFDITEDCMRVLNKYIVAFREQKNGHE